MNWIDCEVCLFSEQCDGPDYAPLCMDFDDDYDFDGYCDDSNPSQGVVGDRAPVIPEVTADTLPTYTNSSLRHVNILAAQAISVMLQKCFPLSVICAER